jgi:formylmethanofuran dehydrogenase subunit D
MPEIFILIPGRTSRQGAGISQGKFQADYQEEINTLLVAPEDCARLGLAAGDRVRLTGEHGQIEVAIAPAPKGELPSGVLFIAYGDLSSRLMGADTHGSGMPTSKGLDVQLERVTAP